MGGGVTDNDRQASRWLRAPMGAEGLAFLAGIVLATSGATLAVANWVDNRVDARINAALADELTEMQMTLIRIEHRLDAVEKEQEE